MNIRDLSIKIVLTVPALIVGIMKACIAIWQPLYDLWTGYGEES